MKKYSLLIFLSCLALLLRGFMLVFFPTPLYWEEVALGYDAWSLSTNGYDYHHHFLPLAAVESFGDYKPSGYFYALALLFKFLPINDLVVRLPSLLAGVALVIGTAILASRLWLCCTGKTNHQLAIFAALLATFNPALFHLSLAAWETNLATAFFIWGIILLLPKPNSHSLPWRLLGGQICLLASFYTYHSFRLIAPLIGLFLIFWHWQLLGRNFFVKKNLIKLIIFLLVDILALSPFLFVHSQHLGQRFAETSIFATNEAIVKANTCRQTAGSSLLSRFFCHRYLYWGREILTHACDHLRLDYLFFSGDDNHRHSSQLFGVFYPTDLFFLLAGLIYLFKQRKLQRYATAWWFLLFFFIISIAPASLTRATPHLLRSLAMVPLMIIIISWGYAWLGDWLSRFWQPLFTFLLFFAINVFYFIFYSWHYLNYYLRVDSQWWQTGYKEAIEYLGVLQTQYPELPVNITRELGRPSIYYFWYRRINPLLVQAGAQTAKLDNGEYLDFAAHQVSFIGLTFSQPSLLMLTPTQAELARSHGQLLDVQTFTSPLNEPVLIVARFLPLALGYNENQ